MLPPLLIYCGEIKILIKTAGGYDYGLT